MFKFFKMCLGFQSKVIRLRRKITLRCTYFFPIRKKFAQIRIILVGLLKCKTTTTAVSNIVMDKVARSQEHTDSRRLFWAPLSQPLHNLFTHVLHNKMNKKQTLKGRIYWKKDAQVFLKNQARLLQLSYACCQN